MALTQVEFDNVLREGTFESLVGETENEWFDAKAKPYQLDDNGKRELARDVAALANARGGVLVIGARTEASRQHFGDEVAEIRPFAQDLVNTAQYRHILDGWIYPRVQGLVVEWAASSTDHTRGVVTIRVPEQSADLRPFLVTKAISGGRLVETFFGYAERRADTNAPLGVIDLHRALRAGLQYERTFERRLDNLEAMIRELREARGSSVPQLANVDVDERVARAMTDGGIVNERALVLTAYAATHQELQTIFSSSGDGIRRKLEQPPVLRYAGWDLSTRGISEIVEGEFVRARSSRKVVDLYRDGTLVLACAADESFLGWAMKNQKLNSLGVIELIYSFVSFYDSVLDDFPELPAQVTFRVDIRNFHRDGVKTKLGPYGPASMAQMFDDSLREAPRDVATLQRQFATENIEPARTAFQVARELYLWFGHAEETIPYVTRVGSELAIDESLIKSQ